MRRRVAGTALWDVSLAGASEYASLRHALHVLPVWLPELVQVETVFRAGSQPEADHTDDFQCSSGRCLDLHYQADCPRSQTQVERVAGDTVDTLFKSMDFLLAQTGSGALRTIRPVTPYPGSDLYFRAIGQGLLKGPEDFYERAHVNSDLRSVNFTDLSDERFDNYLLDANRVLINAHFDWVKADHKRQLEKLYDDRDGAFRGFRQS